MKRNRPQAFSDAGDTQQNPKQESPAPETQNKSPFLKEFLAGSAKLFTTGSDLKEINSDRLAALRYIRESAFIRKLYLGKMSN